MAYQSLYRKYRPQNFSDVVGQGHVVRTLQNALLSGRVAHGYLFTGTRGTAKTTIARLLAKALNCESSDRPVAEPCNLCSACKSITSGGSVDVIEMDAASHRGVADIEEVRKSVGYGPMELRYKVFIIDEAHQLSSDAKDAFLKTLEEPPANVVFILATTEPQAIPITIRSRCQQFDFKRGSLTEIASRLRYVLDSENVTYTSDAINLVARGAEGSYRDSLSLLEQVLAFAPTRITAAEVNTVLGTLDADMLGQVVEAVARRDAPTAFALAGQLLDSGKEARTLLRTLSAHFRDLLLVSVGGPAVSAELSLEEVGRLQTEAQKFTPHQMMRAMDVLNEAQGETRWNNQHRLLVELTFLKLMNLGDNSTVPMATAPIVFSTSPAVAAPMTPQPMPKMVVDIAPTSVPEQSLPVVTPAPVAVPTPSVAPADPTPVTALPVAVVEEPEDAPALSAAFFAADDTSVVDDDELVAENSEDADIDDVEDTEEEPIAVTAAPVGNLPDEEESVPEIDTSPGLFEDTPQFSNTTLAAKLETEAIITAPLMVPAVPAEAVPVATRAADLLSDDTAPPFTDADVPPLDDAAPASYFAVSETPTEVGGFAPVEPEPQPEVEVATSAPAEAALFAEDEVPLPTFDLDAVYRAWPQMVEDAGRISKKAQLQLYKAQPANVRGNTVDVVFSDRSSLEMMSAQKTQEFVRKLLARALGAPKLAVNFSLSPEVPPPPPRNVEKKKVRIDILDAIDQLGEEVPSFGGDTPSFGGGSGYPSFSNAAPASFATAAASPRPAPAYAVSSAVSAANSGGGMPMGASGSYGNGYAKASAPSAPTVYKGIDSLDEGEVYHPAMAHPLIQDVLQLFGGKVLSDK